MTEYSILEADYKQAMLFCDAEYVLWVYFGELDSAGVCITRAKDFVYR
jgi:hypothetical protein